MSQDIEDKTNAGEVRTRETRGFMQQVGVADRRKYTRVCFHLAGDVER